MSTNPEVPRGFILGIFLLEKTYPSGETNPKSSRKNLRNLSFLLVVWPSGEVNKKKTTGGCSGEISEIFSSNFPCFGAHELFEKVVFF